MERNLAESRKKKGILACFEKTWRAKKSTFSLSQTTTVVSFPSQSDLDPSEPQPGPFQQPNRRVFKPTVFHDPAYSVPGCCNWEQTPCEDNPGEGPSGVNQPFPEEPADSQLVLSAVNQTSFEDSYLNETAVQDPTDHGPEQQKRDSKKKKRTCACLKKKWRAMKGAFLRFRNNKVVPSSSPPSDPQTGQSEQTVTQVPAVFLPSCCNREQTPPEDPADHQQVSSGLDPTAPADHRPEQQTTQNKKKDGIRAYLKIRWQSFKSNISQFGSPDLADSQSARTFSSLYEVGKQINSDCSLIYEGIRRSDGLKVAIKFVPKGSRFATYINIPGCNKPLLKEVALNLLLHKPEKCPNIVQMLDWFDEENQHVLILDYPFSSVSLEEFINKNVLSKEQLCGIMRQAVVTVKHFIDHNVYNRLWSILINADTIELQVSELGEGHGELIISSFEEDPESYWQAFNAKRLVGCLGRVLHNMIKSGCLEGVPEKFAKECRFVSCRWFYLSRYFKEPYDLRNVLDMYLW